MADFDIKSLPHNSELPLALSSAPQELLSKDSAGNWLQDNIWKPAVNTAVIEPHNAITSPINDAARGLGAKEGLLADWNNYELPQARLFSSEWFAQNISSGLAMVVPYGIAALTTRGGLRSLGAKLETKGLTAEILKSKSTATILGASIYDGLRKPKENETRLGNALGGAVGFSIFEGGNHLSRDLKGGRMLLARALTGMTGATTQHSLSHFVATGLMPDKEHLLAAAASGATMNIVLPKVNEKLVEFANAGNKALGRGQNISDYLNELAARQAKDPLISETLAAKAAAHPFARVQEVKFGDSRSGNLIKIGEGPAKAERLGHELSHLDLAPEIELRFENARKLQQSGQADAAKQAFVDARVMQEQAARLIEQKIAGELGSGAHKSASIELAPEKILAEIASNGKTYAENFLADFLRFQDSKGRFRPQEDFRPFNDNSAQAWQKRQLNLSDANQAEKLAILANLKDAPESQLRTLWGKLLKDPDTAVRQSAVDAIASLPPAARYKCWLEAAGSHDAAVRAQAISNIGKLPADSRYDAFKQALKQRAVLSGLQELDAASRLVKQIETLPSSKLKEQAWNEALADPRISEAAKDNLAVLPEGPRANAWRQMLRQGISNASKLAEQIPELAEGDRVGAWRELVRMPGALDGQAAARALASLPEGGIGPASTSRFAEWRRLLTSSLENGGNKGVFECIQQLPESMRATAWHAAFAKLGPAQAESASRAINSLPEKEFLPAMQRAVKEAPSPVLAESFNKVPAESVSALQKSIVEIPDAHLRAQLTRSLPIWKLSSMPLENRVSEMQKIFAIAAEHPDAFPPSTLRHWWWHLLPEKASSDPTVLQHARPLQEALAASLPAKQLASIIFPENPELASRFADASPQAVREISARFQHGSESSIAALEKLAQSFLESRSLPDTARLALSLNLNERGGRDSSVPDLLAGLAKDSSTQQYLETKNILLDAVQKSTDAESTAYAVSLAGSLRARDPASFDAGLLKTLEAELISPEGDYMRKLSIASELARLSREGRLGDAKFSLPELRMPKVEIAEPQQAKLRNEVETALFKEAGVEKLLGAGTLGKLFPQIFGEAKDGGIVGRKQGQPHEFSVDKHTLKLIDEVRKNPEFNKLSPADQTNLLWAALLHDTGKQPGLSPVGHEWASAKIAYGVLSSLGYPPERVQRIAALINRHNEAGYLPGSNSSVLADPKAAQDLAVFYRHPEALRQLAILNESDIRAITADSRLWTGEAKAAISEITAVLARSRQGLNIPEMPILLSQVKPGFGLRTLEGDWRLLLHTSGNLESKFFEQLPVIESPNYSISTSLLTPGHLHLYSPQARLAAIIAGPPENISMAAREAMTGTNVNWTRHLAQTAAAAPEMLALAAEVDAALARRAVGPKSLKELAKETARFDNIDQIPQNSPLRQALDLLISAMTRDQRGKALNAPNEVKLNNPTVVGIGIMSGGKPLVFEGMDAASRLKMISEGKTASLIKDKPQADAVVIPESLWKEAVKRHLPFLVLDQK